MHTSHAIKLLRVSKDYEILDLKVTDFRDFEIANKYNYFHKE